MAEQVGNRVRLRRPIVGVVVLFLSLYVLIAFGLWLAAEFGDLWHWSLAFSVVVAFSSVGWIRLSPGDFNIPLIATVVTGVLAVATMYLAAAMQPLPAAANALGMFVVRFAWIIPAICWLYLTAKSWWLYYLDWQIERTGRRARQV